MPLREAQYKPGLKLTGNIQAGTGGQMISIIAST